MGRGLELTVAADHAIEVFAEIEDPHKELPRGSIIFRLELSHSKVGA